MTGLHLSPAGYQAHLPKGKTNPFVAAQPFLAMNALDRNKTKYICYTLSDAQRLGHITMEEYDRAYSEVSRLLGQYVTVESYLLAGGHLPADHISYNTVTPVVQLFRLRWLQHLGQQWDEGKIK